jgi:site-specific DNA recombinase
MRMQSPCLAYSKTDSLEQRSLAFNRQRFSKDPGTGRRIARWNSVETWKWENHPELRIVSDELWAAVAARREALGHHHELHRYRRHRTLLSGLIRCEECGAPMAKVGDYFRCTSRTNSMVCDNNQGLNIKRLESSVMTALRQVLDRPDMLGRVRSYLSCRMRAPEGRG